MTNGEKYKNAQERENAFWNFCEKNVCLNGCPLYKSLCDNARAKRTNSICHFAWLDLEAEEENPLPCPFCGDECKTGFYNLSFVEICIRCGYRSEIKRSKAEAIAAHNRVAKAVKEVKE